MRAQIVKCNLAKRAVLEVARQQGLLLDGQFAIQIGAQTTKFWACGHGASLLVNCSCVLQIGHYYCSANAGSGAMAV
jgi:hypothetical protein